MKKVLINNRIRKLIDSLLMNNIGFAKSIGIYPQTLNNYLNGKRNITNKFLLKIKTTYPQVNINWLKSGEGEIFTDVSEIQTNTTIEKYDIPELLLLEKQIVLLQNENKALRELVAFYQEKEKVKRK